MATATQQIYELGYSHQIYRGVRPQPVAVKYRSLEIESSVSLDLSAGWAFFSDSLEYAQGYALGGYILTATIPPHAVILDLANVPEVIDGEFLDSILPGLADAMGFDGPEDSVRADELWERPDYNMKPLAKFARQHGIDIVMWIEGNAFTFVVVNPDVLEDVRRIEEDED